MARRTGRRGGRLDPRAYGPTAPGRLADGPRLRRRHPVRRHASSPPVGSDGAVARNEATFVIRVSVGSRSRGDGARFLVRKERVRPLKPHSKRAMSD
jgi:hypothetical protein